MIGRIVRGHRRVEEAHGRPVKKAARRPGKHRVPRAGSSRGGLDQRDWIAEVGEYLPDLNGGRMTRVAPGLDPGAGLVKQRLPGRRGKLAPGRNREPVEVVTD